MDVQVQVSYACMGDGVDLELEELRPLPHLVDQGLERTIICDEHDVVHLTKAHVHSVSPAYLGVAHEGLLDECVEGHVRQISCT